MKNVFFILFIFLSSCYKNHLYVQHDKIDVSYLASSVVQTPDPRQKNPPCGQRMAIAWDFPLSIYRENLSLILTVRFWDNVQDIYVYKIPRKRGYKAYLFPETAKNKDKKILTYKVDIINEDGVLVDQWKHQFWKKLIKLNEPE